MKYNQSIHNLNINNLDDLSNPQSDAIKGGWFGSKVWKGAKKIVKGAVKKLKKLV